MWVLNVRGGDVWASDTKRATIVGGDDRIIRVRVHGEVGIRDYSFRYFVRRFQPVRVKRFRKV